MKKKIMKHAFVIIGGFIVIYILSLIGGAYQHQTKLNQEVLEKAKETKDFDDWFSYQTVMYRRLLTTDSTEEAYQIDIYATVEQHKENAYETRVYVMIIPLKKVTYALSLQDTNDQMQIVIADDKSTMWDSKEAYKNQALSYGLSPNKPGFVYAGVDMVKTGGLTFKMFDYEGLLIAEVALDETILLSAIKQYDSALYDKYLVENHYKAGKTSKDISAIVNPRIQQTVFIYVTIYFGVLLVGYGAYYGIKSWLIINKRKKEIRKNETK